MIILNTPLQTSFAEKLMDNQQPVSLRTLVTKLFMRPKLFLICMLLPPVFAMFFTSLVPVDWRASAKILIRYSSTESPFLKGLIPDNRLLLSGSSSAELLKSTPTIEIMVNKVGVKAEDVYQKPTSVVSSYLSGLLKSKKSDSEKSNNNQASESTAIASAIQASLEGSAASNSKSSGVEILKKTSQVPDTMKGDELLSIEVRSFNREKVADMTNGLANAFIDEYYRISAEDAHKSYLFLSDLVEQAEASAKAIEDSSESKLEANNTPLSSVLEQTRQDSPFLANMSRQLTEMETTLAQTQQIYSNNAPKVSRLRNEISQLKLAIKKQERVDTSKQVLEQLKVRKYQAYNTENLYKNRLIPITIVEPATMPAPSKSKALMKYVVSVGVSLLLGIILGISLTVVLNLTDPRLYLRDDIQKITNIPILGTLATLDRLYPLNLQFGGLTLNKGVEAGLLQILGYIAATSHTDKANTILLASPAEGDGASFVSLALAGALAKNSKKRVLLIDANFTDKGLSQHLNAYQANGMIEAMLNDKPLNTLIIKQDKLNIDFIAAGNLQTKNGLGFYTEQAKLALQQAQSSYDFIIIDSGALLVSNEALMFGAAADKRLLVLSSGISRKGALKSAITIFNEIGLSIDGIIFNRYKLLLPKFIYRNI